MSKTTNFFTEIGAFLEDADLKITLTKKGEIVTATLLPELKGGEELTPFTATGTILELDEGFLPAIKDSIQKAGGFKTNSEQFEKSVTEAKEETAGAAKKKTTSKPTTAKKSKAKPAPKKAAPKAKPAKKAAKPKKVTGKKPEAPTPPVDKQHAADLAETLVKEETPVAPEPPKTTQQSLL